MSAPIFEFETECDATLIQTWRVVISDPGDLSEEELLERVTHEFAGGACESICERGEDEEDREVIPESIVRIKSAVANDTPYTVIGVLTDSRDPDGHLLRFARTYLISGDFRAAEALALREHPTLAVAGVASGEIELADVI